MIVDLPDTDVSEISKRLVLLRREGGATTLARVLTLVIVAPAVTIEETIAAATLASSEHPMRIIAVGYPDRADRDIARSPDGLDGQIRIGRDAGAGDVIVLFPRGAVGAEPDQLLSGLLLADAPVVVWWAAGILPSHLSVEPLRRLAQRRIMDSGGPGDPTDRLRAFSESYRPGDTDIAWSRLTLWRAQLASAMDNSPGLPIESVTVTGTPRSSSTLLLAAWLRLQLGVPVTRLDLPEEPADEASLIWGIHSVQIHSPAGDIAITRTHGVFVSITQPGHPALDMPLPRRSLSECLAEDLRVLHPDPLYGRVVTEGLPILLGDERDS